MQNGYFYFWATNSIIFRSFFNLCKSSMQLQDIHLTLVLEDIQGQYNKIEKGASCMKWKTQTEINSILDSS